jgi:hypothetical protein
LRGGFSPKTSGNLQDINPLAFPPRALIAGLVQLPMMAAAQRHGEFIAHLEANGSGLGKPQVMRIGGLPAADETRLCGDESQVRLVAQPFGFGNCELALVDPGRREFSCGRGQRRGCHSAFPGSCLILPEQVCHGAMVAPTVVMTAALSKEREHLAHACAFVILAERTQMAVAHYAE